MEELFKAFLEGLGIKEVPAGTMVVTADNPAKDTDNVVGEMDAFEKACWVALNYLEQKHVEVHTKLHELSSLEDDNTDQIKEVRNEHEEIHGKTDLVQRMMYRSIKMRCKLSDKQGHLEFTVGDKIVEVTHERDLKSELFRSMFSPFGRGQYGIAIVMGGRGGFF